MEATRLYGTDDDLARTPGWFRSGRTALRGTFLDSADSYPCYFAGRGELLATNYYTYITPARSRELTRDPELYLLGKALRAFLRLPRIAPFHRLSLLCLAEPVPGRPSFEDYQACFWNILRGLIAGDTDPWPTRRPADPDDPAWNFCFSGEPLFTFGACPAYLPRRSRALGSGLVLVFQPLTIFADIRGNTPAGRAAKWRIRQRLAAYEDVPVIADTGDGTGPTTSKWKQYFPAPNGKHASGNCPLFSLDSQAGGTGCTP